VRSSGQRVDHYFETLGAAHSHNVARAFAASSIAPTGSDVVAGVMWGGCYLAATAAADTRSSLILVDPDSADPVRSAELPGTRIAFVDDLVNSGTDFRLCERLAAAAGMSASFHALYSPHARAALDQHDVTITHQLVRP
jgi:orotate phosphoribosyltransferase